MHWFVVTLPDSTTQEFELQDGSKGQDLLFAVCDKLKVIEHDYFGLQYYGPKGEKLWLNRRNKICRQLTGSQPFRLRFRMKFFVKPPLLVEESSMHYCFQTCKKDFVENATHYDDDTSARIHALLLQASDGDFERLSFARHCSRFHWSPEFSRAVELHYASLTGTRAPSAEYECLKEFYSQEDFGDEYHRVRTDDNTISLVGVGRHGLRFCDENRLLVRRVGYSALNKAWRENRCFSLELTNDDGTTSEYELRLISAEACVQLFRSVTECHSFFGCETVNSQVKNQFTRDLKDSIISFFSEEMSEKLYTFDVDKTVIEAHDHARRVLYKEQQNAPNLEAIPCFVDDEAKENGGADSQNVGKLQEKLDSIHEAFLCKICMDASIDSVLIPCGHWICCSECGSNISKCPLCRCDIEMQQKVYMDLPGFFNGDKQETSDSALEKMNICGPDGR